MELPQCLISKVTTLADNTCRITLDFQEMSAEKMAEVFLARQSGEVIVPSVELSEDPKTPSQRLKSVLFLVWKQTTDQSLDFEVWYRQEMSRIREHYKEKLN